MTSWVDSKSAVLQKTLLERTVYSIARLSIVDCSWRIAASGGEEEVQKEVDDGSEKKCGTPSLAELKCIIVSR
jgi:hypothetical protein